MGLDLHPERPSRCQGDCVLTVTVRSGAPHIAMVEFISRSPRGRMVDFVECGRNDYNADTMVVVAYLLNTNGTLGFLRPVLP